MCGVQSTSAEMGSPRARSAFVEQDHASLSCKKLDTTDFPSKKDRYRLGHLWAAISAFHVRASSIIISYLGRGGSGKLIR
jgi:hypothetical protein